MSDPPPRATRKRKPVQTQDAREGTRSTVAGWLTTMSDYVGGQRKGKIYDEKGFRPGRAQAYPKISGEEMRSPALDKLDELTRKQWADRRHALSLQNATSEDNIDRNVPAPKPWFIVPSAPTPGYVHRQSHENEIWARLSEGGARIALVGKGGIGYGVNACRVCAHLT